jgi:hypothetical protein
MPSGTTFIRAFGAVSQERPNREEELYLVLEKVQFLFSVQNVSGDSDCYLAEGSLGRRHIATMRRARNKTGQVTRGF